MAERITQKNLDRLLETINEKLGGGYGFYSAYGKIKMHKNDRGITPLTTRKELYKAMEYFLAGILATTDK